MKKVIVSLTVAFAGLFATTSANATVYFQSNFDGLNPSTKVINGGLLSLTAYGEPNNWGIVRDNALTIYSGQTYNGANSGAISGLATDLANGLSILRMTGSYKTFSAYDGTPWASAASIQWQNTAQYFTYNTVDVGLGGVSDWTNFTLDLNLAGLASDRNHIGEIQANFFIGGTTPGDLHLDNLKIETVASVPEPSVASLLGFGVIGLVATRFRRRS
jgi:hypothetical protein